MSSSYRLTGTLAGSGGLVVGFLTGRWLAAKLRAHAQHGAPAAGH